MATGAGVAFWRIGRLSREGVALALVGAVCAHAGAFLSLAASVAPGWLPPPALLGLVTLPIAALASRSAFQYQVGSSNAKLVPDLAMNVLVTLLTPFCVAAGLFLARPWQRPADRPVFPLARKKQFPCRLRGGGRRSGGGQRAVTPPSITSSLPVM